MSRWAFQGTTRDGNGRVIISATVSVYLSGTDTAVTIYEAYTGGTAVNSVTSSATTGHFIFFVDDTEYANTDMFRITMSKTGYETKVYDYIDIVGAAAISVVTLSDEQTMTNKTLTTPVLASFYQDAAKTKLMTTPNTASDTLAAIAATQTLTNKTLTSPVLTTPQINDTTADHQYVFAVSELTADRTITLPLLTGNDEVVFKDHTQTLTNKTLTTPTIDSFANANHTHVSAAQGGLVGLLQYEHTSTSALASGSTTMPVDDTIPQITEGFEVITCAITPLSATNILIIIANITVGNPIGQAGIALFQDATANALASVVTAINIIAPITLVYKMVAGTTSATTFRIRVGCNDAGTIYINNVPGATGRVFGGVASTTLTIIEVVP